MLNRKSIILRFLVCSVVIIVLPSIASALLKATYSVQRKNYYKTPKTILSEVSKRGKSQVASELYSNSKKWNYVLKHISEGSEAWIGVATTIYAGSDAGANEMLTMAIGEALGNAPGNVLRLALPKFQLKSICGTPDVDDSRFNSYELAISAIEKREKQVLSLKNDKLKRTARECVHLLEESKMRIAEFYGKNNED